MFIEQFVSIKRSQTNVCRTNVCRINVCQTNVCRLNIVKQMCVEQTFVEVDFYRRTLHIGAPCGRICIDQT